MTFLPIHVMAGLVPAIHVFLLGRRAEEGLDARHKAGHDDLRLVGFLVFHDDLRLV
jgi:hypothetical protein